MASIARIGREKRLAALAKNLYVIEGDNAGEVQRRAERALLRANPALAARDGFESGRMVVVPPVPGLRVTARVNTAGGDLAGILTEAAVRLEAGTARIEQAFRASEERRETALKRLQDPDFAEAAKRALRESPDLLKEARASMEKDREAAEARRAAITGSIEATRLEIERILGLLRTPDR